MKHLKDPIGIRFRDLPACSADPQPTALPRASVFDTRLVNSEILERKQSCFEGGLGEFFARKMCLIYRHA